MYVCTEWSTVDAALGIPRPTVTSDSNGDNDNDGTVEADPPAHVSASYPRSESSIRDRLL